MNGAYIELFIARFSIGLLNTNTISFNILDDPLA